MSGEGGRDRPADGAHAYLTLPASREDTLIPLEGPSVSIGKGSGNDVAIPSDPLVSRMHAAVVVYPAGWCIRDLSSSNGTFVNGERVFGDRPLADGDQITVGDTVIAFHSGSRVDATSTTGTAPARPDLTRRERDVLLALCRPLLDGDVFTEPASIREIAADLTVTEAAVKQHLTNLYDKFAVHDPDRRRLRLANEALRRGAITLADLRASAGRKRPR